MTWKIVAIDADFNKPCWEWTSSSSTVNPSASRFVWRCSQCNPTLGHCHRESKKNQIHESTNCAPMHCSSCQIIKIAGANISCLLHKNPLYIGMFPTINSINYGRWGVAAGPPHCATIKNLVTNVVKRNPGACSASLSTRDSPGAVCNLNLPKNLSKRTFSVGEAWTAIWSFLNVLFSAISLGTVTLLHLHIACFQSCDTWCHEIS